MNADLTKIYNCGLKWKVVFAREKCKAMILSKQKPSRQPDLILGGVSLEEVDELDILGVKFSKTLNFHSHIDSISKKTGQRVSVLWKVAPLT